MSASSLTAPYPEIVLYTGSVAGGLFYTLGRIAGVQARKAKWIWQSVAGSEADAIQAERSVGRDMAAALLDETPRDSDQTTQALVDEVGGRLTAVVRNRLHRFQMTAVKADQPTAFALPGGFIFVAGSLVNLCHRDRDEVAFVLAHEMAHVIRRHAIDRLLKQQFMSAVRWCRRAKGRSRCGFARSASSGWSAPTRGTKSWKRTSWACCSCARPDSIPPARFARFNAWANWIGVLTLSVWAPICQRIPRSRTVSFDSAGSR